MSIGIPNDYSIGKKRKLGLLIRVTIENAFSIDWPLINQDSYAGVGRKLVIIREHPVVQ